MSASTDWSPVPTTPFARAVDAAYVHSTATGAGAPGGNERSWGTAPDDTQLIVIGKGQGQRFRALDLVVFGSGAENDVVTIPEMGLVEKVAGRSNQELDACIYEALFQTIAWTLGTKTMSDTLKAELGLTGTIRYADTLTVGAKTAMWTSLLQLESGRDLYLHSPGDNTIAKMRVPYTADARAFYVYRGSQSAFGMLARPYGGR